MEPVSAQVLKTAETQDALLEVLRHPITQDAQFYTESAFRAFLKKQTVGSAVLKFFNGWNETHKTTSLVSAKIIMCFSADTISVPAEQRMAHMHEVAKDDFGLEHPGHDGMYSYMTTAFAATDWLGGQYKVQECNELSDYLYNTGVVQTSIRDDRRALCLITMNE